jgi:hypothetical protein
MQVVRLRLRRLTLAPVQTILAAEPTLRRVARRMSVLSFTLPIPGALRRRLAGHLGCAEGMAWAARRRKADGDIPAWLTPLPKRKLKSPNS